MCPFHLNTWRYNFLLRFLVHHGPLGEVHLTFSIHIRTTETKLQRSPDTNPNPNPADPSKPYHLTVYGVVWWTSARVPFITSLPRLILWICYMYTSLWQHSHNTDVTMGLRQLKTGHPTASQFVFQHQGHWPLCTAEMTVLRVDVGWGHHILRSSLGCHHGKRPPVSDAAAVTKARHETRWNLLHGCPKLVTDLRPYCIGRP